MARKAKATAGARAPAGVAAKLRAFFDAYRAKFPDGRIIPALPPMTKEELACEAATWSRPERGEIYWLETATGKLRLIKRKAAVAEMAQLILSHQRLGDRATLTRACDLAEAVLGVHRGRLEVKRMERQEVSKARAEIANDPTLTARNAAKRVLGPDALDHEIRSLVRSLDQPRRVLSRPSVKTNRRGKARRVYGT